MKNKECTFDFIKLFKSAHYFFVVLLLTPLTIFSQDFLITEYGAIGDGVTINTKAIQTAVDSAHHNGGGRVVIPGGRYLSGAIQLKSGVTLHVVDDAVLLGSTNPDHYFKLNRWKALLIAEGAEGIGITGSGEINGQGRELALTIDSLFYAGEIDSAHYNFVEMRPKYYLRPQLIEFVRCKNIEVRNVTLKNAACWVQTHHECENIVIDSVRTDSDAYWNNDGIDIQDCKNVRITNCYVNSADDGICLKSHTAGLRTENVVIENCVVRSSASAVKFGTRSHGGFKNVRIRNIKVFDTFRSAIAVECVDGGILEDVVIDGVHAENTGNAIFVRLGKRHTKETGELKDVIIKNVFAQVAFERPDYAYDVRGPSLPFFHNPFPASITGIPGHPVSNLALENIEIMYPGRGNSALANMPLYRLNDIPEAISDYPEFSMFGELPAWGLYVRHVDGLSLKNIKMSAASYDYRPSVVCDDVSNLDISQLEILGMSKKPQVILKDVPNPKIDSGIRTQVW